MKRLVVLVMFVVVSMINSSVNAYEVELRKENVEILFGIIQLKLHDEGSANYADGREETAAILFIRNAIQRHRIVFLIFNVLTKELLLLTIQNVVPYGEAIEIARDLNKAREKLKDWLVRNETKIKVGKLDKKENLIYTIICRSLNQKQGEITAIFDSREALKVSTKPGGTPGGSILTPYTESGQLQPFKLTIKGTGKIERSWMGGETYYWEKTIEGPKVEFSQSQQIIEAPRIAKPEIVSDLKIVEQGPYKVGQTITAMFSIKNNGTQLTILDVLTVGGRLNGECPEGRCPDFKFQRNILLEPGMMLPYEYKGTLKLKKPGHYHFFSAYMTKDYKGEEKWNTAIPTAPGVTNTKDIFVKTLKDTKPTDKPKVLNVEKEPRKIKLEPEGKTKSQPQNKEIGQVIVGRWKEANGTEVMEFLKDGTVIVTDKGMTMTGSYKFIDDKRIKIELKGIGILAGPGIAEISTLGDELVLKTPFGEGKYKKIKR
jgi:hypothetical protein